MKDYQEAVAYLRTLTQIQPQIGLILGSGLGSLADEIEHPVKVDYHSIPHFPTSTVHGHAGKLVFGTLEGKSVVAMQGRIHLYEGYSQAQVTFPVRVMKALGVEILIVTNACGGIHPNLYPGALMFIRDHINLTGGNPLVGPNDEDLGPRFPDMSTAYTPKWIDLGKKVASELGIETFEGVYTAVSGPYYLGKAELTMVRGFGSDTIGMSTVPEVIAARHMGIQCLGISCITDRAIPEHLVPLAHEEVIRVADETRPKFMALIRGILEKI